MVSKVFLWEFLSGKRPYLILLLYFLLLLSSGKFIVNEITVEKKTSLFHSFEHFTPGNLIDVSFSVADIWWFSFPVVTAYAVFTFSYELDKGILKTYLLSRITKTELFTAKLLATFMGIYTPLILSLLIAYTLADTILFRSIPLEVYVNLPQRLVLYASMLYTMIGLSVFSGVAFKKPLYAFVIPIATIYTLNTASISMISRYIPPLCFPIFNEAIGLMEPSYFWSQMGTAIPSVIASTIFLIASYVIFVKRDIA